MKITIPNDVVSIMDKLKEAGYEAYVVGGAVRDSVLGISPKDWDLTTNAKPEQVEEVFKDLPVIETGMKHGTVTIVFNDENYEITTYRIDGDYSDGRHPDNVKFTDSLKEDLSRRDLTINAMAASLDGEVVDYFNGLYDIENKIIRTVGKASERFSEDALRMFRAVRFATKYKFRISQDIYDAINELTDRDELPKISSERISSEVRKILETADIADKFAVNDIILMEFLITKFICRVPGNYGLSEKTINAIKNMLVEIESAPDTTKFPANATLKIYSTASNVLEAEKDFITRFAILYRDLSDTLYYKISFSNEDFTAIKYTVPVLKIEYKKFNNPNAWNSRNQIIRDITRNFFKLSNKEADEIKLLCTMTSHTALLTFDETKIRLFLSRLKNRGYDFSVYDKIQDIYLATEDKIVLENQGANALKGYVSCQKRIAIKNKILERGDCLDLAHLAINGNDIIKATGKTGEFVGGMLEECLKVVLEDPSKNTKENLLYIVKNPRCLLYDSIEDYEKENK